MRKQKSAPQDYSYSNWPKNRWEAFWDCLRLRSWDFLRMGGILLLFSIPALLLLFYRDYSIYELNKAFAAGEITEERLISATHSNYDFTGLLLILAFGIFAIGLSGVSRLNKRIAWAQSVFFHRDFMIGIKENWKKYLFMGCLIGVINFLCSLMVNYGNENLFAYVPYFLTIALFLPASCFYFSELSVYNLKFGESLRLAFVFYFKNILFALPSTLLLFSPLGLLFIPSLPLRYGLLALAVAIVSPFLLFGFFLFSCFVFDKDMNKRFYPDYVDKGIYRKDEEGTTR